MPINFRTTVQETASVAHVNEYALSMLDSRVRADNTGMITIDDAWIRATALLPLKGGEIFFPPGVYAFNNLVTPVNLVMSGAGRGSKLKQVGAGVGITAVRADNSSNYGHITFRNLALHAATSTATTGIKLINIYIASLQDVFVYGLWPDTGVRGYTESLVNLLSVNPENVSTISIRGGEYQNAVSTGHGLYVPNGGAAISATGARFQANDNWNIYASVGSSVFPTELALYSCVIEGSIAGSIYADWLYGSAITGCHFEQGGGNTNPLLKLGLDGVVAGLDIVSSTFGGAGTANYAIELDGAASQVGVSIRQNTFSNWLVAGVKGRSLYGADIRDNERVNCPKDVDLINFDNEGVISKTKDFMSLRSMGQVSHAPNFGLQTEDFGSGKGILGIGNAKAVPSGTPVGGGVFYVEGGAAKYKGSSGTVTILGPA